MATTLVIAFMCPDGISEIHTEDFLPPMQKAGSSYYLSAFHTESINSECAMNLSVQGGDKKQCSLIRSQCLSRVSFS